MLAIKIVTCLVLIEILWSLLMVPLEVWITIQLCVLCVGTYSAQIQFIWYCGLVTNNSGRLALAAAGRVIGLHSDVSKVNNFVDYGLKCWSVKRKIESMKVWRSNVCKRGVFATTCINANKLQHRVHRVHVQLVKRHGDTATLAPLERVHPASTQAF